MESFRPPVFDDPRQNELTKFGVGSIEIATKAQIPWNISNTITNIMIAIPLQQVEEFFSNCPQKDYPFPKNFSSATSEITISTVEIRDPEIVMYGKKTEQSLFFYSNWL